MFGVSFLFFVNMFEPKYTKENKIKFMATNSIAILLLILPSLFDVGAAQQKLIKTGSIISPRTDHQISWPSPSGKFEFGFYKQGNGFAIGIWLVGSNKNIIVWTANRDDPPVASNAMLLFNEDGLRLIEQEDDKLVVNTSSITPASASMLDSGNFVIYNSSGITIWESFKNPSDTILGGQVLYAGGDLYSSQSETNHSTGGFNLRMQEDGNLVIYPGNTDRSSIVAYWSTGTIFGQGYNLSLYLSSNGTLGIVRLNDVSINGIAGITTSWIKVLYSYSDNHQNGTVYRATLDPNGMFRLYSHGQDPSGKLKESVSLWSAPAYACDVSGFCGINSFCTMVNSQPNCTCIPGSDYVDLNNKNLGCLKNYSDGCVDGKENITLYGRIKVLENITWGDIAYYEAQVTSKEECSNSCLKDCNCGAALFEDKVCKKQKLPLRYARRTTIQGSTTALFKVGKSTDSNGLPINQPPKTQVTNNLGQIIALSLSLVIFSCVSIAIACLYIFKSRTLEYIRVREIRGQFELNDEELTLRVFSYKELKKATNDFKDELGKGSFGAVYRGALSKGTKLIAVKRLEKLVEEGEREFRAEMRTIGRTHHKNLVRLLGYCAEGSKRLLVYEYMSNGSLANLLFKQPERPYWDERVRIAVDVARGIHYLHDECKAPVIHCDVKPQNILMDDLWTAKISDFGLAKLLMPDQTRTFTGVRGTRGYLAPEWHKNTPITVKADVYSYGIVLLEIICCRRNLEVSVSNLDELVLSNWVYQCLANKELHKLVVGEDVDRKTLEIMVKVGLWCIQDEPVLRPSMKSVVLMLEGITDIASPPCPTSASM